MVGTNKVQKPNSGRLANKPANTLFKALSPLRSNANSLLDVKNDYIRYQTVQTPLKQKEKTRNPDKGLNSNKIHQTPRVSVALYNSNGLVGNQSNSNQLLSAAKPSIRRKTLFQSLNEQKPIRSAQKPTPQNLFIKKTQIGTSQSTQAYSASTLIESKAKNNLAVITQ